MCRRRRRIAHRSVYIIWYMYNICVYIFMYISYSNNIVNTKIVVHIFHFHIVFCKCNCLCIAAAKLMSGDNRITISKWMPTNRHTHLFPIFFSSRIYLLFWQQFNVSSSETLWCRFWFSGEFLIARSLQFYYIFC